VVSLYHLSVYVDASNAPTGSRRSKRVDANASSSNDPATASAFSAAAATTASPFIVEGVDLESCELHELLRVLEDLIPRRADDETYTVAADSQASGEAANSSKPGGVAGGGRSVQSGFSEAHSTLPVSVQSLRTSAPTAAAANATPASAAPASASVRKAAASLAGSSSVPSPDGELSLGPGSSGNSGRAGPRLIGDAAGAAATSASATEPGHRSHRSTEDPSSLSFLSVLPSLRAFPRHALRRDFVLVPADAEVRLQLSKNARSTSQPQVRDWQDVVCVVATLICLAFDCRW
jgi:hypothetical protein